MRNPTDRPNVILINCDDLGYGDLGCYGSPCHQTPALDRLAGEGMRFTDFYMAAPVCTPSRAAMMTGCYPQRCGMGVNDQGQWVLFPGDGNGLNPEEITIARCLKDQGYATSLVGKWHLGDQPEFLPTRHGFDEYFGIPYSNDMGIQKNREHFPPMPLMDDESVLQQQPDQAGITERYVEQGVRFMRAHRDEPFFLYFAHMYVHLPLIVPQHFLARSQNGTYGAAVECIDWAMSVIMHELRALGLEQNTIVIFTSDNGSKAGKEGGSNAPLAGRKGQTYEGGMRVPCIVRWPGQIEAGSECHALSTAMDLLPTLVPLCGGDVPSDRIIDGHDLRPLLFGQQTDSPYDALFYYLRDELQAVRAGQWKLHLQRNELYDLASDVGEQHNVYEQHPDVVRDLRARADACRKDLGDTLTETEGANRRPPGRVDNPQPLTRHDPEHPYIVAMYDIEQAG